MKKTNIYFLFTIILGSLSSTLPLYALSVIDIKSISTTFFPVKVTFSQNEKNFNEDDLKIIICNAQDLVNFFNMIEKQDYSTITLIKVKKLANQFNTTNVITECSKTPPYNPTKTYIHDWSWNVQTGDDRIITGPSTTSVHCFYPFFAFCQNAPIGKKWVLIQTSENYQDANKNGYTYFF